jgi:ClpP class serine protease
MATELELVLGVGIALVSILTALSALLLARPPKSGASARTPPEASPSPVSSVSPAGTEGGEAVEPAEPQESEQVDSEAEEAEESPVEGQASESVGEMFVHEEHEGEHSKEEIQAYRRAVIAQLERERGSKVITMIHRKEPWTGEDEEPEIVLEDSETILSEIRKTAPDKPIDMILHTPGGVALAAEMIAMAFKFHKGKVTVMVPFYAMSGGSMIALSSDEIRMEKYSILGPVDPQIEGMPAASLMAILKRKPLEVISDRTLVLSQVAEMQTQNAKDFVKWLLRDRMGDSTAEKVAEFLAGGYLAHETPITLDVGRALGLPVVEGVPDLVYKLFKTFDFGEVTRPGKMTVEASDALA